MAERVAACEVVADKVSSGEDLDRELGAFPQRTPACRAAGDDVRGGLATLAGDAGGDLEYTYALTATGRLVLSTNGGQ